ncbi:MAG TPA: IS91 family transposase [Thermoanaerobaculia bacterium]
MIPPAHELAEVFRRHGARFRERMGERLPVACRRVMSAIEKCRTAALGGHMDRCTDCGHRAISYNSCRNRHCPKCQGGSQLEWLADREGELLPVPYFHVVFTIPDALLSDIAFQNKRLVYGLLFKASAATLLTIGRDSQHLGADVGFFGVLHTWGQNLLHHPHVHYVVPSGGLSRDRSRWISCRKDFFLPVRVLSSLFRRLFLEGIAEAFRNGALRLEGALAPLADPRAFAERLAQARAIDWVVYVNAFGAPRNVLRYLSRYVQRVALSNRRILAVEEDVVRFLWRDSRHRNRQSVMSLPAHEFIRRFLLHVLPRGFRKVRHFGFLANRNRTKNIALCRQRICQSPDVRELPLPAEAISAATAKPRCTACGSTSLVRTDLSSCRMEARLDSS